MSEVSRERFEELQNDASQFLADSKHEEALDALSAAHSIASELNDESLLVRGERRLGSYFRSIDEPERGCSYVESAFSRCDAVPDWCNMVGGEVLVELVGCHARTGRAGRAEQVIDHWKDRRLRTSWPEETADLEAMSLRAVLAHRVGDLELAEALYLKLVAIENPSFPFTVARAIDGIVSLYRETDRHDEADAFLQRRRDLYERSGPGAVSLSEALRFQLEDSAKDKAPR